jgi:phage tail sheath protein FI
MAPTYKTPGVYVVETNAFPNSVVEVATAVPAFIGYTQFAANKGSSLENKPSRISSMAEYLRFFGGAPRDQFTLDAFPSADARVRNADKSDFNFGTDEFQLINKHKRYYLYYSMMMFFQNGGGACYIVSVGNYKQAIEKTALESAFDALLKEQEPTLIVIPDAMSLTEADCISLQQASLMHCGSRMKNRFAILDVYEGYKDRRADGDCIAKFRNGLETGFPDFGAAYYPWINADIVQMSDLDFGNLDSIADLKKALKAEVDQSTLPTEKKQAYHQTIAGMDKIIADAKALDDRTKAVTVAEAADFQAKADVEITSSSRELHKTLSANSPLYVKILKVIQTKLNLLPPAAAMAGIYTMVDNTRGAWKAPANVSMNAVVSPAVNITHEEQEDLNVSMSGKSINAIRSFIGEGTLVWGARTLDGNSLDWRYINVRRTMIMLEESIRLATKAYVFEPNVADTWVTIKSMISNFLYGIWKRGGLAGASPEDAFSVHIGLGETMTPEDIVEGIMRVTVLLALSRPAEFIEITFQQQMQNS